MIYFSSLKSQNCIIVLLTTLYSNAEAFVMSRTVWKQVNVSENFYCEKTTIQEKYYAS